MWSVTTHSFPIMYGALVDGIFQKDVVLPGFRGILLIDKPTTWSSHDVVNWMRRQTGEQRVGHAGTLDPLATGLLLVLVGRQFTKRQSEFLKADKEYVCRFQLGVVTDTYDRDGRVVAEEPWSKVSGCSEQDIEALLPTFTGELQQVVPLFSAVKVAGERLHRVARKTDHISIELPVRTVRIHELELLEFTRDESEQKMFGTLRVWCGSGTYIRSLVHDLGRKIGVGAMVTELRRTKIGDLTLL